MKKFLGRILGIDTQTTKAVVTDSKGNVETVEAEIVNDNPSMLKKTLDTLTSCFQKRRDEAKAIKALMQSSMDLLWLVQNSKVDKETKENMKTVLTTAIENAKNPVQKFQMQMLWNLVNGIKA